jgi:hypothetical protein
MSRSPGLMVALVCLACARPPLAMDAAAQSAAGGTSVAVYSLSKGRGVPPETKAAFQKARTLLQELEGKGGTGPIEEQRIGLEGETRLCVEFKDEKTARDAIERLRAIAREVTLLNVQEEPCRKPEQREEKP